MMNINRIEQQLQLAEPKREGIYHPAPGRVLFTPGLDLTEVFSSISLEELGTARLMDRRETKYLFMEGKLSCLLQGLSSDYQILEIQGRRSFRYRSMYFDTPDRFFFQGHHAGALPRWKIRQRTYLDSQITYLEVKHKDSRGITHKSRQPIMYGMDTIAERDQKFLASFNLPPRGGLMPVLETRYTRMTLVHRERQERITLDRNLRFSDGTNTITIPDLIIAEIKQDYLNNHSPFILGLKECGIRPGSFSKYCVGSLLLDPSLKHNRFKPILHQIHSLRQGGFHHEWTL